MEETKTLGLKDVISVSVGLVVATSCLVSLGQGAGEIGTMFIVSMVIACLFNMITLASISELNALMPNTTGGLAQYTLAAVGPVPTIVLMVGGYLLSNILSSGVEASIFSYAMGEIIPLHINNFFYSAIITVLLMVLNLRGVDMFAKLQDATAYLLLGSMLIMGIIGAVKGGTGAVVNQPAYYNVSFKNVTAMTATAFWLFIGAEYAIPISKNVKNAKKNVPLGMFIGLGILCFVQSMMVLGFHNYTSWNDLMNSPAPHMLYGYALLGKPGRYWMAGVAALALISTQNSTVQGLSSICQGMAKMDMLPHVFARTNKKNVPWFGVVFVSALILLFAYISNDSSDAISFLILVGSVFWMFSYIFAHIDVLVFRKRFPKAPRSFKVPGGIVLPILGIIGTSYMILNISTDPVERNKIWMITGITFAVLFLYAVLWIKFKMKIPVWKSIPIHKVLARESPMYYYVRHRKIIPSQGSSVPVSKKSEESTLPSTTSGSSEEE